MAAQDSREERAFRAWFNSLNIDREVTDLFGEIGDGIILLQAEDKLRPGIVDWCSERVFLSPEGISGDWEGSVVGGS